MENCKIANARMDSPTKQMLCRTASYHNFYQTTENMGFNIARFIGVEPSKGFFSYFAYHDLALVADLVWKIGGGLQDKRIANLVDFIKNTQGPLGLWEYSRSPVVTHWLTFSLLRSLARIEHNKEWVNMEPPVAFRQYKKTKRRY